MNKIIALVILSFSGILYGTEHDIKTITAMMDAYEKQLDSIKLKYICKYPTDEQGIFEMVKGAFAQNKSKGYILLNERRQTGKAWDDNKEAVDGGLIRSYNGQITRYLEHEKNRNGHYMAALYKNHNLKLYKTNGNPYYRFYRVNYVTKLTYLLSDPNAIVKIQGREIIEDQNAIKISVQKKDTDFDSYIWLLPEKNYLPIRYKTINNTDGSLFWQMNWSEYKKLNSDIWFPMYIENYFGDVENPTTIRTEEIDISPLTKEDFKFEFPPLTHVTDELLGTSYLTELPTKQPVLKDITPQQLILLMKASRQKYVTIKAKMKASTYENVDGNSVAKLKSTKDIISHWAKDKSFSKITLTRYKDATMGDKHDFISVETYVITPQWSKRLTEVPDGTRPYIQVRPGNSLQEEKPFYGIDNAMWDMCGWKWDDINIDETVMSKDEVNNYYIMKAKMSKSSKGPFVRLYIDPSKDFIPIKKEFLKSDGTLLITYQCSDFRKDKNGLWIPYQYSWSDLNVHISTIYDVEEAILNEPISPDMFNLTFPDGTFVIDKINP